MRLKLLSDPILITVSSEFQQERRAAGLCRLREFVPNGRDHAQVRVAVEAERVVARRYPDLVRYLEDGLEADAFLADEAGALAPAALSALADATDCIDILPGEPPLVAIDPDEALGVPDGEGGDLSGVRVVVRILDKL